MKPADDHGSVSSRLRAFLPLLICLALLFLALAGLFHASQSRRAIIQFTVSVEGAPAASYSARLNGSPYRAGERCGLGSKSITIKVPDAEPFQTNLFAWYSGADLGNISLSRSKGTLILEVAPTQNGIFIHGDHFQKEISNCGIESLTVPVGEYEVLSQFEHFQITKRATVRRTSSTKISIRPPVTTAALTAQPADAQFRFECQSGFPIVLSGKTPATIDGLPIGKYHLTIWRGEFQKTASVDLISEATNHINVSFDYAEVSFKSEPSGAEIRQGDVLLGQTPAILTLIPGSYRLSLRRDGYFTKEAEFEVKGNEQREVSVTLLNVAFSEAFNRAKSLLNGANPDYSIAFKKIEEALEIQPNDPNALHLRDEIQFAQAMAGARDLAKANDFERALKIVNAALDKRPAEEHALRLKNEFERRKRESLTRTAEERRQRPAKAFAEFTRAIKHNGLFDTQKMTIKSSPDKVLAAINRLFSKDKANWTKRDRSLGNGVYIFDADMRSLFSKQRAVFLVGQITDDTCEVYFKLWQYKRSNKIQIINGKMTEDSWSPVHPSFSPGAANVVNHQRSREMDTLRQRFETELKAQ